MPLGPNTRYNSNTFGIDAKENTLVIQQDTGIIPESHDNFIVYNIGRTAVHAELKYGTKVMWHGITDSATVQPGEWKELDNGGRPYYVTGLQVYNNTDERAVVHCATSDDKYYLYAKKEEGSFDEIRNKIIKSIVVLGLKYVPYVGSGLSGLVGAFWPSGEKNVWEQVQGKVEALVDQKVLEAISGILNGDIRHFQERITVLSQEVENGGNPEDLRMHYMNIAQDLIGFEKSSCSPARLQTIKTSTRMKEAEKLGLTEENVSSLKSYAERTIYEENSGANKYIADLYKNRVDNAYKKVLAEDLYDNMMNVRTFIGTQGFEYIRIWNYLLEHLTDEGYYNDVISYSTVHGRQTANLIKEATAEELLPPFTPSLIDGKRNQISSIDIQFENGDSSTLGNVSDEVNTVEFNGALLKSLQVYGDGAIDSLTFTFADERVVTCGEKGSEVNTVFELDKHHIVSIFLATDNWSLGGQAANICVAYRLKEKESD
ncbi:hypothetical protein NQ318_013719 [Aromia moschata]|uniref:Uncharacterized protein n=1 Tax=Aromia moschata TaxID=1265417 RepID=A0AAV8Z958_9CUCU|nr:hypothetical protein NQ318_013719 [Aromia moschata]